MATYLVTGAGGFIGSNLARALIAEGNAVRGIDDFSTGRRENIRDLPEMDFAEADITQPGVLDGMMRGVDFVLHQAAIPSVPRSVEQPVASHEANATGTLKVLEAARRAKTVRRVVYASSSSVYGNTPILPKHEDMPVHPESPYAVSKLAGECYVTMYSRLYGLPGVALRYFNVFGPGQDPTSRYSAVIAKFVASIVRGESPPVYGDGRQTRDFTYIDNVVEANLRACVAPEAVGAVMNIACGAPTDLLGIAQSINEALGVKVPLSFLPPRKGDVKDSLADISRARALLGYQPQVSIKEGLARYVRWCSQSYRAAALG